MLIKEIWGGTVLTLSGTELTLGGGELTLGGRELNLWGLWNCVPCIRYRCKYRWTGILYLSTRITHVFTTSIYYVLNVENSPNLSEWEWTCYQLIIISPYYITMKSTSFNHWNWGLLRTSKCHHKRRFLSGPQAYWVVTLAQYFDRPPNTNLYNVHWFSKAPSFSDWIRYFSL